MRPYLIESSNARWWIDLDHVLAISDLRLSYCPEFDIVFAFRDKPLTFEMPIDDQDPEDKLSWQSEKVLIEALARPTYDKLLAAWKEVLP